MWWWPEPPFVDVIGKEVLSGMSSALLSSELPLAWCTWVLVPEFDPALTWSEVELEVVVVAPTIGLLHVRSCAKQPSISMSTKNVFSQKWNAFSPLKRNSKNIYLGLKIDPLLLKHTQRELGNFKKSIKIKKPIPLLVNGKYIQINSLIPLIILYY